MKSTSRKTLLIAIVVSLGGFLFGFDASVISGVIRFIKPEFNLSDLQLGWVASSPSFAAMFAMLVAGRVSDVIGRKRVLILVAFLYALSALLSAFATGYMMLVVARMIGGVAFGAALILAPMYIAEIAPASDRGKLVSVQQLNIVLGFSVAYFSNYFVLQNIQVESLITEDTAWRWMLGIELLPAMIYFSLLFWVPRSPRWLFIRQQGAQAEKILEQLHGKEMARKEAEAIQRSLVKSNETNQVSLRHLFARSMRFVVVVGLSVGVIQQITGVNAIYFYATTIFEQSGVGTDASFSQAVWVGIVNVIFTVLAMTLIDRMGRKPLMLIGVAGVAISMCLTAYGFNQATYTLKEVDVRAIKGLDSSHLQPLIGVPYLNDVDFKNALKAELGNQEYAIHESALIEAAIQMNPILILIGILGFVASFAFSLGPVMWVLLSELFPNHLRGLAVSAIGFVNSLVSWLVQFVFPWELSNFGNALTYLIYGVFAIIGLVVLARILPETKGKSLEEIERELVGS